MNKLRDELIKKIERREKSDLKKITPRQIRRTARKYGEAYAILDKSSTYSILADLFFLAAEFERSSRYDADWKECYIEKTELTEREKGRDSDAYQIEIGNREMMGWRTGDLDDYREHVIGKQQPCEIPDEVEQNLEFREVFLEWAILRERINQDFWIARINDATEWLLADISREFGSGEQAFVVEAFLIHTRLTYIYYWLGDFGRALEHAEKSVRGVAAWSSCKPKGMVFDERTLWKNRVQGISELLLGRDDPSRLGRAVNCFCKAIVQAEKEVSVDAEDLPVLLVTALAWSQPEHEIVSSFRKHYPHLAHLIERERGW
jgi:hypothetical protein